MNLPELTERAWEVELLYKELQKKNDHRAWGPLETVDGLVGDVGALTKLVMIRENYRSGQIENSQLEHELADCLWAILVLSKKLDINLESALLEMVDQTTAKLAQT